MGIQLRIALKEEVPQEFELSDISANTKQQDVASLEPIIDSSALPKNTTDTATAMAPTQEQEAPVANRGNTNGQA